VENDPALGLRLGRREVLAFGFAAALAAAGTCRLPTPQLAPMRFAIAGGFYHGLRRVRALLTPGTQLELRAEPSTPYDANAVAVLMPAAGPHAGLKLGYLPRRGNREAALWLARGAVLRAEVVGTLGLRRGETIPDDLVFTSYSYGDPLLRLVEVLPASVRGSMPAGADAAVLGTARRLAGRGRVDASPERRQR